MTKEDGYEVARREKAAFREKGGKSVGDKDSVVDGHLSGAAGATQEPRGGKPEDVRPRLEEASKALSDAAAKGEPAAPKRGA